MYNENNNKPFYKRPWVILIVILLILCIFRLINGKPSNPPKNMKQQIEQANKAIHEGEIKKRNNTLQETK